MTLLNGTAKSLERQRAAIDELNQKLTQSQKMEAMGQLTGGVAHDFNNLLTVILGNAEHLAEKLAAHKELHDIAESIATAAERGSDLTRSLLAFARKQPLMPRDIDIGQKILGMEQLLRRTLGEHIECEFRLDRKPVAGQRRSRPTGLRPAQSGAQRARRHAVRRQADGRGAKYLAR